MRKAIQVLAIGLIFAAAGFSQTNRGGISGAVTDPSGAVVPGATVIITNLGTDETFRATTSSSGTYSIQNLEPVTYKVEVEAKGFEEAVVGKVKVDTASIATANVALQAGSVRTQVQVTAQAPLINTESGTLGETISQRMLTDLPLANRSVLDLAVIAPNVSGDVGSEDPAVTSNEPVPGFNLSLNGGRPGTSTMLADGVSNTGVGIAREVVSFSPETVQEFTVQTSAYSAAFGRTGGGVINVTTKSGTNHLHGGATWYNRNPATNAAPFTLATVNRPVNNLRWNQFSFDLGGPVVLPKIYNGHDRTFFFAAVEPRWQGDTLQEDSLLPTMAMRQGDFSNLTAVRGGWAPSNVVTQLGITPSGVDSAIYQQYQLQNGTQFSPLPRPAKGKTYPVFPGNIIPQNMLDPVSLKLLAYMPQPQAYYVDGSGDLADYTLQRFVHENQTRYQFRVDQVITNNNRAFFRFTAVPEIGTKGFGSPVNGNGATYSYSRQYVLEDTETLSPTIYNDLRLNYTYGRFSGTFTPQYDIKTGKNLSTELGLPSLTKGGLPGITFDTLNAFAGIGSEGSTLNDDDEKQYQIADNLYISHGRMTWTAGIEYSRDALNVTPFFAAAGGRYDFRFVQTNSDGRDRSTGNSFASFLLGVPNDVLLADTILPYRYRWSSWAAFVQNDWKVRSNLTLNLGLRYSLQFPRWEASNFQGVFQPSLDKTYPLSQPVTVPGFGTLPITSVTAPTFAYSGVGSQSKHLTPTNWYDFEPRFGFAYSPHWFGWNNFVVRGGYGISHVPLTGMNRLPDPNFGTPSLSFNPTTGQKDPNYIMRLCCNPPDDPFIPPSQVLGIPSDGLVNQNSIDIPGFILSSNTKTPYAQNWNLSFSKQLGGSTVLTAAYVGAKGTHLYLPAVNANLWNPDFVQQLLAANLNPRTTTIADPLGRTDPKGRTVRVPIGTLESKYLGFANLTTLCDASGNSIRHAFYVNVMHRAARGLTLTGNYTVGKSIDDASTSSPDKNVLTSSNLPGGQITYGGTAAGDRSVSTFDIKHQFNATFIYDLPFGRGREFLSNSPKLLEGTVGGWTVSGVERFYTGFPAVVTTAEGNYLGAETHDIRPDLAPGVPLVNPLYNRNCPLGTACEPYLNPAAFMVPPVGTLGTAPRTLDGVRGPWQQTLDLSLQKNFQLSDRIRLQFRVDAINLLNHPVFRLPFMNDGGSQGVDVFGGEVTTSALSSGDYNNWAKANNQPRANTSQGAAMLAQINSMVNAQRLSGGALPANFYTVPVPQGFAMDSPYSFDITTLNGYKMFRLRQNYNTRYGSLYVPGESSRYLQFGVRIFF